MIKDQRKKKAKKQPDLTAAPIAPGAEPSPNGPKRTHGSRKTRRTDVNLQLLQDLAGLRNSVDEMMERYAIRVNGQVSELMQLIQGDGEVGDAPNTLTVKTAEAMMETIRKAGLKPKKGRGKDFVRIQRLVTELRSISPIEG